MRTEFESLLSPIQLGTLSLKNRMAMPPMVTHLTENGHVTAKLIQYYKRRAEGGVGLIVVEAAYPSKKAQPGRLAVYDDLFLDGLAELAEEVHGAGANVALEINPGRGRSDDVDPATASESLHPVTGKRARALAVDEIRRLVEEFGKGVERAKRTGFDAVMIHSGHGYVVSEFLSPRLNKRDDEYGGDLERRARFALELVQVSKASAGEDYPVIFRLSASERVGGGISIEEAAQVCKQVENAGADAIDVVSGAAESVEWVVPYMSFPMGCNVDLAKAVKQAVTVPVMVAGRINSPFYAEEVIRSGYADIVDLGRALIADPDFAMKIEETRPEDIRPCLGCNRCVESFLNRQPLACAVNPAVGKGEGVDVKKSLSPKRVLVVGGGPAGMQAAAAASARGNNVTLWEKGESLGGQLNIAGALGYKQDILSFVSYLQREIKKANVDVRLNKLANLESIRKFKPDVVIVATGAIPRETGLGRRHTKIELTDNWRIMEGRVVPRKNVVIIGGGLAGCETAEMISKDAESVSIVEKLSDIANDAIIWTRKCLKNSLKEMGVRIFCDVVEHRILDDGIEIQDQSGERQLIKADQIIFTIGSIPNRELAVKLKDKFPVVFEIGDCTSPKRILEAIHEGAEVGSSIG